MNPHGHSSYKTGRKPAAPQAHHGALRLRSVLRTDAPIIYPDAVDHLSAVALSMYANNQFGVCGPAAIGNQRRILTTALAPGSSVPSLDDIFALYRLSGNPRFDPTLADDDPRQQDEGVELQTMLEALMANGIGDGKGGVIKPLAFAAVDPQDDEETTAAIAAFGSVIWGVDLDVAQQAQTDAGVWDYKASRSWGGHATVTASYSGGWAGTKDRQKTGTWAKAVDTTDAFRRHQLAEAWVVIWPENVGTKQFMQVIDSAKLASEFARLTGKTLVIPTPDVPTPPTPAPSSSNTVTLTPALKARVDATAKRRKMGQDAWVEHHLRSYFNMPQL